MEATRSTKPKNDPAVRNQLPVGDAEATRTRENARMFDRIARRYDFLNRLLSFRRDVAWRRRMAACLPSSSHLHVLDVAAGTADSLLSLVERCDRVELGVGLDVADRMLRLGQAKLAASRYADRLHLVRGDGRTMPFSDGSFDAVTIAFGIRNFVDVSGGLHEFYRVLKPGGRLLVLEFSLPANAILRRCYLAYFRYIMPLIGRLVSGDEAAYHHLNQSVENFPYGAEFCEIMKTAGFESIREDRLSLGVATIYEGHKAAASSDRSLKSQTEEAD